MQLFTSLRKALWPNPFSQELTEYEKKVKSEYERADRAGQLRVCNSVNDQLIGLTTVETSLLPTISVIAAALLIVASFNPSLIPLTRNVRIYISILLVLIPVALFFFSYNIGRAKWNGLRLMYVYRGESLRMKGFDRISYASHLLLSLVLLAVVFGIICAIWHV